jgi:hypothetical protein
LTAEKIQVKVGAEWVGFLKWIHTLVPVITKPEDAFQAQRHWWKVNKKLFWLMGLPLEVRNVIYEYAFGPVYPYTTVSRALMEDDEGLSNARVVYGRGLPKVGVEDDRWNRRHYKWLALSDTEAARIGGCCNLALLRASLQVHSEALKVGWESTRKCFADPELFATVLETARKGTTPSFNWLNKLQLGFTSDVYVSFFGMQFDGSANTGWLRDVSQGRPRAQLLLRLPNLRDLQLRFLRERRAFLDTPCYPEACQRTLVDWIMTFAYPYIKHIRKVTLTGDLRTYTKKKWEFTLDAVFRGSRHGFNHGKAVEMIMSIPAHRL